MLVREISAVGFKNLSLAKVPFQRVTLVHGDNGIGKSNLLRLVHVAFTKKVLPQGMENPKFSLEGPVDEPDLVRRGLNDATVIVKVGCSGDKWEALLRKLGLRQAAPDKAGKKAMPATAGNSPGPSEAVIEFAITSVGNGTGAQLAIRRITIGDKEAFSREAKIAAPDQAAIQEWIADELENSTVYVPASRLLARDDVTFSPFLRSPAVRDLENTILRLLTSRDEKPETFDRILATMKRFFKTEEIRVQLQPRTKPGQEPSAAQLEDVGVRIRIKERNPVKGQPGEWFDLAQVGSGIQQLLVIVSALAQGNARVALLEEFDTSLSPKMRNRMLGELQGLVGPGKPLRQVITTTHITQAPAQDHISAVGASRNPETGLTEFTPWTAEQFKKFQADIAYKDEE